MCENRSLLPINVMLQEPFLGSRPIQGPDLTTIYVFAAGVEVCEGAGLLGGALLHGAVLSCGYSDLRLVLQPRYH